MANVLIISSNDDVAVALSDLPKGVALSTAEGALGISTQEMIPFGHKVAIRPVERDEPVIKYGASIGVATESIAPGEHVHTHNLQSVRGASAS
ncbi:MAG: UxaA family hydrolase [Chloroflexota bacterium]|nr:UxaA family hydrolase [Chloroflexota bacterium]